MEMETGGVCDVCEGNGVENGARLVLFVRKIEQNKMFIKCIIHNGD